jgi:hypothetical protein
MRVTVSKTVRMLYGTKWRKRVRHLVRAALAGSEGVTGECFTCRYIKVNIALSKKGVTITAQPDFLPELEECELRVENS